MIRYLIKNPRFGKTPSDDHKAYPSGVDSIYTEAYLTDCHSGGVSYSPKKLEKTWKKYWLHEEKEAEAILTKFGYKYERVGESEKYVKPRKKVKA